MHYLWNASAHLQKKVVHTCSRFLVDALVHYIKTHIICGMHQRIYKKVAHTQQGGATAHHWKCKGAKEEQQISSG